MDILKQKLLIEQVDRKLAVFYPLRSVQMPQKGWVHTIRTALKMSLRQLGNRLKISPQSVKELEAREANGSITLKGLREAGAAIDMKLVYGFVPKEKTIEEMIEARALEIATEIVMRTSQTMQLENQKNSKSRLKKAIKNRADEIKIKMPKYLWD
ncbi:MAG: XRE family transcriptional regulator [Bacteroidetes bacterium GWF2_38_335]|nr:MAG: XRE family transcriptional regulator [Bacteroidetes bacterium GWF2_38_335]OFY80088.1 MAG: XRE family transcriptional regulator [Bacteroidetes bacterium RIFOXYA12_FULL_38_20]HBS88588.1 mobile mystery protein A [Bacteroidales bacterium]